MSRNLLFLLLFICINKSLRAQQSGADKKANPEVSRSNNGFKKKGSFSTQKQSSSSPIAAYSQTSGRKAATITTPTNPPERENATKASEAIRVDYNNMPVEVKSKINNNKSHGKYLLEGIVKAFMVEINTCITDADQKKTLLFLKNKKGFISSQFISAGLVRIIVEPSFDSADLKDAMLAEGIHFNFLNRSYLLKN